MANDRPRQELSFACSRRSFWRALVQEALVISGMLKGGQECRLAKLGSLSDSQLAEIRPMLHPSCETFIEDGAVWIRYRETDAAVELFSIGEAPSLVALGMFDGQHTLGGVGARLSQAMGWEEAKAFAHARDLFLSLVDRLICIPKDPLDFGE